LRGPRLHAHSSNEPCICTENECGVVLPRSTLLYLNTEQLAPPGAAGTEHCDCIAATRGPKGDTMTIYYLELKNIGTRLLLKADRNDIESLADRIARKLHNCHTAHAARIEALLAHQNPQTRFIHAAAAALPPPSQLLAATPYTLRAKLATTYRALLAATRERLHQLCKKTCRTGILECGSRPPTA